MSAQIPAEALQLRSLVRADQMLELFLDLVPVPEPGPDEVVIRVEAAPLNPSDMGLLFGGADMAAAVASGSAERPVVTAPIPDAAMRGLAGRVGTPMPVGNEGAGTVVAAGESPAAQALLGAAWGIGGWLLTPFLQKVGLARVAHLRDQVAAGLMTTFASSYTTQVSLPGALSLEAIADYGRQATGSKYVIIPSRAA
jgi:NADPH:quinone reductase